MFLAKRQLPVILFVLGILLLGLPSAVAAKDLELSVGLKGGLNATAVERVPNGTIEYQGQEFQHDPPIAGGFGIGGAYGLKLEFRAIDIVGLETGFYRSHDRSSGETIYTNTPNNQSFSQEQTATSFRFPVLVKLTPPLEPVRPIVGLGIEYVNQQSSSFTYSPQPGGVRTNAIKKNYLLLQATVGVEIDVTEELRIPLELRGSLQPGWDASYDRRVETRNVTVQGSNNAVTGITYDYTGDYQAHFGFFTGISYRWDFGI
jgi:opacity protein-like surface antigen